MRCIAQDEKNEDQRSNEQQHHHRAKGHPFRL